ncbi:hypothetical protein FVEG_12869 [Fusarium verticillioides 7600]|uniref:2EXR domain-containing protein n=1 Tax=Gibberella moniliformis (strain M3125 / FGSC 7600) TaxID=334819 RepID=W7N519_GIBM7|nr:hypothetical protein FVEG_12869 [Fusarium verticillioides 7600]EWG54739.1 hypothetical protein FVEG_12869 [Fusarium verticillioides 7600]
MTQPMVFKHPDHGGGLKQIEEMPALSANEVSLAVFHLFQNLPTELRLKIWKAACFPHTSSQQGLHYIDLASIGDDLRSWIGPMEMKALHPDFPTSRNGQRVVGRANRSAHMWDAGLWKACQESREVISSHFRLKLWCNTQNSGLEPLESDECLGKACQPYPSQLISEELTSEDDEELSEKRPGDGDSVLEPELFLPTCPFPSNQEHEEPFMVMPTRDLFCIQDPGKHLLPLVLKDARLNVPCPGGKTIVLRHSFNLALEEKSPRAVFANWAQTCNWSKGNAPCIYLLNKAARSGSGWCVNKEAVFHDCDDAYVEVQNHYLDNFPVKPAEASAMLGFLWLVWNLWTVAFCNCTDDEICMMCNHGLGLDLTKYVKVLVRQEEEPARYQIEDRVD